jgi:ornithine cyclodeaminase/alanine dehydrogenase-like protein (mu-crystallin family)
MGGYRLSQLRTGATSALAVKYLSRRQTGEIGLIGSGVHARVELEGLTMVRELKEVKVYSPNPEHHCTKYDILERKIYENGHDRNHVKQIFGKAPAWAGG